MTNSKRLSIVTPVWNGMPFIRECVESVQAQSFQNWRLIINDNGSTDGTREYLRSIADPRIEVYEQSENLGIFGSLNFLFQKSTTPFTQILCADDVLLPNACENILRSWERVPNTVGAIRFNKQDIEASSCACTRLMLTKIPATVSPQESPLYFFLFGNFMGNLSANTVRTECVKSCGWFDTSLPFCGDFDFWTRLGRDYSIHREPIEVTFVRRHPGVASNYLNQRGELVGQNEKIIRGLFERLLERRSRWLMKLFATMNYDTQHRHCGVRRLLAGNGRAYLQSVEAVASKSPLFFSWPWRWLIYLATGAGHWGRAVLKSLLN
jgi:glycosyltransferase involved in cell wall biosynthesis